MRTDRQQPSKMISRKRQIIILSILFIAFSLQVFYALKWQIGYDEIWNLYYSKITPFTKSFIELKHNAHPPLQSILLRLPMSFGTHIFWARLGSILPSCLFIFIIFLILKKLCKSEALPYIFSFMLAISHTIVNLSVCVRAYTLMAMFISLAIYYFIDIIRDFISVESWKIRAFVFSCVAAVWTEYIAGFIVLLLCLTLFLSLFSNPMSRKDSLKRILKEWDSLLILTAGFVGIIFYFKWTWMPVWQGHVSKHYLKSDESILSFFTRGIFNNFSYFTPLNSNHHLSIILFFFLAICFSIFFIVRFVKEKQDNAVPAILLSHLLLWGMLILTGIKGLYPFGGAMRHQFIIFPLFLLSAAILLDQGLKAIKNRTVIYILCAVLVGSSACVSIAEFSGRPVEEFPDSPMFKDAFEGFHRLSKGEYAVYLTHFNSFAFLYHKLDRQWRFRKKSEHLYYVVDIEKGNKKKSLVIDRTNWLVPIPLNDQMMLRFNKMLEDENIKRLWVFSAIDQANFLGKYGEKKAWAEFKSHLPNQLKLSDCFAIGEGFAFYIEKADKSFSDSSG